MSEEKKYPPLVIELVGTTQTNWILEGTEKDPKHMSWPGQLRIPPTSKIREDTPGSFRFKPIRHIAGCDIIDPVEQDKQGNKPNLDQGLDNIWISGGTATFLREGSTIGTYDYIKNYEGNVSNPLRPPEAENVFREVVAIDVAKSGNVSFDKKADAYAILREIRQPEGDGYVYQEEKLVLLSTLFDLNHLDSNEEKFLELYRIADSRPELIVNSVANGKKKLFALIKKADDLAVISFTDESVRFTESKIVLLAFKGRVTKNNQINKLADYLLTEEGKLFMQQLTLAVETAGKKTLEPVKVPEETIS